MSTHTVRLATRGSSLALRQANAVKSALETRRRSVELVEVETRGDEIRDELTVRTNRSSDPTVDRTEAELIVAGLAPHALDDGVSLARANSTRRRKLLHRSPRGRR